MKRIALFLLTNIAVIITISVITSLLGVGSYITAGGLDLVSLLIFSAIVGFSGSLISLLLSKWMAKTCYGVRVIDRPSGSDEVFLFKTVEGLAGKLNIQMPEVGVYDSPEPNAFATGASRNSALVAISTGLLQEMNSDEIEGVLGHEMAHVANGDMVTMGLIQGVVNTFVVFFARVAAYVIANAMRGEEDEGAPSSLVYFGVSIVCEIVFGFLASLIVMWFSRYREFAADRDAGKWVGKDKMISALQKLKMLQERLIDSRTPELSSLKISSRPGWIELFSSHPNLDRRIEALKAS